MGQVLAVLANTDNNAARALFQKNFASNTFQVVRDRTTNCICKGAAAIFGWSSRHGAQHVRAKRCLIRKRYQSLCLWIPTLRHNDAIPIASGQGTCDFQRMSYAGAAMAVRAVDAWSIARFCALVAEEADDDIMCRSLVNIRDVWIDIANECELLAGRLMVAQHEMA
jgi:hypothetical protein